MTRLEEEDNKYLFCYMKDNETWYSEYDNFINRVRYFNPLSASYYGLQFHNNEEWLHEVCSKLVKHYEKCGLEITILAGISEEEENKDICFRVYITNKKLRDNLSKLAKVLIKHDSNPLMIYHEHNNDFLLGYRKMLVQLAQDITFKYN